jgi:N-sulfoglucosamine sulfohydrolase
MLPEPIMMERQRPGNQKQTVATPRSGPVKLFGNFTPAKEILLCDTPGASIAYRFNGDEFWKLYVGPLTIKPGQTLEAKACRIGYKDSKSLTISVAVSK